MITRLMLDLETLSTEHDAAVVAIGAVIFQEDDILGTFESYMDINLVIGHRDDDTQQWWLKQDKSVRDVVMGGKDTPQGTLGLFNQIYLAYKPDEVWANAPTFDCTILRNTYLANGFKKTPWSFRDERCFRTLTSLAKERGIDYKEGYVGIVKHNPLSDAMAQTKAAQIILRNL